MALKMTRRMTTSRRVAAVPAEERAGRFINRELSALDFTARILELAENECTTLA